MGLKITKKELFLALAFGILGFLLSTRSFILFANGLNPFMGFLLYYAIVIASVFILSKLGLVIGSIKVKKVSQVIGMVLIFFAFFLIFNWTNQYFQFVVTGNTTGAANIFFNGEDGITYYFWNSIVGIHNMGIIRWLMFPLTAFVTALLGGLLVDEKINLKGVII